MTAAPRPPAVGDAATHESLDAISIGEAAELVGMTPRTLRYYEELGLVRSSRHSSTAQRRYTPAAIERLRQIKELQTLLGLDLDQIGAQLSVSDRLEGLRAEFRSGPMPARRAEILTECLVLLQDLRRRVVERRHRLAEFEAEISGRIARVHEIFGDAAPSTGPRPTPGEDR
ncbi:MAG: MerR family transcriptional regulator [Acidimicrobiales bacterium]